MPEISVATAQSRLLAAFSRLPAETVPLFEIVGRVLAQDLHAPHALPLFDNSAMDGYAVQAEAIATASRHHPVTLPVQFDIPAGQTPIQTLQPGFAARIMTGAPMPKGADTVVPVELTDDQHTPNGGAMPTTVQIFAERARGAAVRKLGGDVQVGQVILHAGQVLTAGAVGLLASLGITQVSVVRRARVGILTSGDELVELEQTPQAGQIRNSNLYLLQALVAQVGAIPVPLGIARDNPQSVQACLAQALCAEFDLLLTSAGVSMGSADVFRQELERTGQVHFWKINMRPGKPVVFGAYQGLSWLALPGNPVSSFVTFEVLARPILRQLMGLAPFARPTLTVTAKDEFSSDGRETYLRVWVYQEVGQWWARAAGGQDSHQQLASANANALLILPAGVTNAPKGSQWTVWLLTDV
jgi:molybdopterin molybdotransferase